MSTRWEYKEVRGQCGDYRMDFMPELNSLGNEGWEVVNISFVPTMLVGQVDAIVFLKRRIEG